MLRICYFSQEPTDLDKNKIQLIWEKFRAIEYVGKGVNGTLITHAVVIMTGSTLMKLEKMKKVHKKETNFSFSYSP